MNVKRKALVPDAQGNVRNTRKHAKRKGAGARVGTWSRYVEKKGHTPPPPGRKYCTVAEPTKG
jgi:hypothetical protein